MQISDCIHAKISPKGYLQQIQREHSEDSEGPMQMEGGRNYRGDSDDRSYPPFGLDPTEVQCLEFYGVPEREECTDDL